MHWSAVKDAPAHRFGEVLVRAEFGQHPALAIVPNAEEQHSVYGVYVQRMFSAAPRIFMQIDRVTRTR